MGQFAHLSDDDVLELSDRYCLDPGDPVVFENARQADAAHGQSIVRNGRPVVSWSTDDRGVVDAYKLLDGLLCQVASDTRADGLAADEFHDRAYG